MNTSCPLSPSLPSLSITITPLSPPHSKTPAARCPRPVPRSSPSPPLCPPAPASLPCSHGYLKDPHAPTPPSSDCAGPCERGSVETGVIEGSYRKGHPSSHCRAGGAIGASQYARHCCSALPLLCTFATPPIPPPPAPPTPHHRYARTPHKHTPHNPPHPHPILTTVTSPPP